MIRREQPGWRLFPDGCRAASRSRTSVPAPTVSSGGSRSLPGRVLIFGHGHFFHILAVALARPVAG